MTRNCCHPGRERFFNRLVIGLVGLGLSVLGCGPRSVTIMEIQGKGRLSPLVGRLVETAGVVTFVADDRGEFFLQDPVGDGDPTTSDGVVVAVEGARVGTHLPSVGDSVRLRAQVEEFRLGPALPRTQLTRVTQLEVRSSADPIPAAVPLQDLPNESLKEGKAFWESLEGMRVSVVNALVIAPTSRSGEFAVLTEADARPGSGFYPETHQILLRSMGGNEVDYNPERILVAGPEGKDSRLVRPGDRAVGLAGVVDYTFGNYKIRPDRIEVEPRQRPETPVGTRSRPVGEWAVATFNVENLFDLEDDPEKEDEDSTPTAEALETKLRKLAGAIQTGLRLPEIVVVQEVENTAVLDELAKRVSQSSDTSYVATSRGSSDRRGIEVGFLWDQDRVALREAHLLSGPEVESAFGPSSESPGREPLVGVFEVRGRVVTIVANHFRSKGGDDPLFGMNDPPMRASEAQRKAQAQVVRDYVESILESAPSAWVIVAGDLNDFEFGEPGEGADHPLAILEGEGSQTPLTNLILGVAEAERYTYVYQGNSQVLDHILVSPALLERVAGLDVAHINTPYPAGWARDATSHLRGSDHDPVVARFSID